MLSSSKLHFYFSYGKSFGTHFEAKIEPEKYSSDFWMTLLFHVQKNSEPLLSEFEHMYIAQAFFVSEIRPSINLNRLRQCSGVPRSWNIGRALTVSITLITQQHQEVSDLLEDSPVDLVQEQVSKKF